MSQTLDILNHRFGIDGQLRFSAGQGGLPRAVITAPGGTGELYLHGAHLTAWKPTDAEPVLWMSQNSAFAEGKPIRGGVPICFPWFGPKPDDPDAPAHGLARLRPWDVAATTTEDGRVTLALQTRIETWDATFTVTFGPSLAMTLSFTNTAGEPQTAAAALHTYFAVSDARQVSITGLENTDYLDKVGGAIRRQNQGDEPVGFTAETDRVYVETDAACVLHDPGHGRRIIIGKAGSHSTVVWNPWIDKAARMPDFGDDEWTGMCCIETAAVADDAVTLEPGATHELGATISVEAAN